MTSPHLEVVTTTTTTTTTTAAATTTSTPSLPHLVSQDLLCLGVFGQLPHMASLAPHTHTALALIVNQGHVPGVHTHHSAHTAPAPET